VIEPHHRAGGANASVATRRAGSRNLVLRIVSAAVLAPTAIACAYAGGWLFFALCTAAAAVILWEWTKLVAGRADARILVPGLTALVVVLLLIGRGQSAAAAARVASLALWAGGGVLYAGNALLSPALLRRDPAWGFAATLFLMGVVWTTDIFGYFVGRSLGGPLLWPRVSPNKTWSGALGGSAGGVVAGICVAYANDLGRVAFVGLIALLLSVVGQAGDLFESAIKRRFGAKDTSQLIPGHGGLMDRLDGFLMAALAAVLIGLLRQGAGGPSQGLLVW
jgi:phosphatidate cytidylyltransferase